MFLVHFRGACWASTGQRPVEPKIPVRVWFFGYPSLRVYFSLLSQVVRSRAQAPKLTRNVTRRQAKLLKGTSKTDRMRDWKSLGSDYLLCFVWEVTRDNPTPRISSPKSVRCLGLGSEILFPKFLGATVTKGATPCCSKAPRLSAAYCLHILGLACLILLPFFATFASGNVWTPSCMHL